MVTQQCSERGFFFGQLLIMVEKMCAKKSDSGFLQHTSELLHAKVE